MNAGSSRCPLFAGLLRGECSAASRYEAPDNGRGDLLALHLNENLFEVEAIPLAPVEPSRPLSRYPFGGSAPLARALSEALCVPIEAVFVNHGSVAVLNAIFAQLANSDAITVLHSPSWGYYREVLSGLGVARVEVPHARGPLGFRVDPPALLEAAVREAATLVVLASPNNPTGCRIGYADIEALAGALPDTVLVLDEAYLGFAPPDPMPVAQLLAACPNLIVVRTFSKALGLAGLRVGFALAGERLRPLLQRLPVPFGISEHAQGFALARLADRAYGEQVLSRCGEARRLFERLLGGLEGFFTYPSEANFVLVRTPPGRAEAIHRHLALHGILVKLCDPRELPDHLRITLAPGPVMARVAALVGEAARAG